MKSVKMVAVFAVMLMLFCVGCGTIGTENDGNAVYRKVLPSTVEVVAEGIDFTSTGTGFYIDNKGTVVTNFHVIENCQAISIKTYDGGSYSVENILGYDKTNDLAILSTSKKDSVPAGLRKKEVVTGETVYALGSSLGLQGTFSEGIVSSAAREIDGVTYIQTTAPISNGNSGGPLVDSKGAVVGITTAGFDDGQNLNLAIPVSAILDVSTTSPMTVEEFYETQPQIYSVDYVLQNYPNLIGQVFYIEGWVSVHSYISDYPHISWLVIYNDFNDIPYKGDADKQFFNGQITIDEELHDEFKNIIIYATSSEIGEIIKTVRTGCFIRAYGYINESYLEYGGVSLNVTDLVVQ